METERISCLLKKVGNIKEKVNMDKDNNGELISIIVTIYNAEKYLRKCLDSIINQTYKILEIILVNDGSQDKSGAICDEYALIDKRIKVFHTKNNGPASALNTGLANATGDYIGIVDCDDWVDENFYEIMLKFCQIYQADISICGYYRSYEKGGNWVYEENDTTLDEGYIETETAIKELIFDKKIHSFAWNKLYRRNLFEQICFPADSGYEDMAIMYKLFQRTKRIAIVNKPLYYYYMRSDSILHTRDEKLNWDQLCIYMEMKENLKEEFPELEEFQTVRLAGFCYSIHNWLLLQDSLSEEAKAHKRAIEETMENCREEICQNNWGGWKLRLRLFFSGKTWYPIVYRKLKIFLKG